MLQNVLPFAPPGNREMRRKKEKEKEQERAREKEKEYASVKLQSPEERKKVEEQNRKHRNDTALRNLRASKPRNR